MEEVSTWEVCHHRYLEELICLRAGREVYHLPAVSFYLFGMGARRKMLYRAGKLLDACSGEVIRLWEVTAEQIFPAEYAVRLLTGDGGCVWLQEDEEGVWLEEDGRRTCLSASPVHLPRFAAQPFAAVLRVLHQEILINVIDGKPVPNFFVYGKPWYRDAAMMAMVLQRTGNLHLIRDWVLGLSEPYDANNGEEEADNLGQALYLLSLFQAGSHPFIRRIKNEIKRFRIDNYLRGRTDGDWRPVYQTAWLKLGLQSLGMADEFQLPSVPEDYAGLCWWAAEPIQQPGRMAPSLNYPYLTWAEDHTYGERRACVGDRPYPLTWEAHASQADYPGMGRVAEDYVTRKLATPHTWHAAEMFLALWQGD